MSRLTNLHPCLLAAFPCLSIYSQNVGYTPVGKLVWTLLAVEIVVLVLWLAAGLALRSWRKAGLLVSLFLVVSFSFGPLASIVKQNEAGGILSHYRLVALAAGILVLGAGTFMIARARSGLDAWRRVAGVFGLSLVMVASLAIGANAVRSPAAGAGQAGVISRVHFSGAPPGELPDIYYIVPDAYGRSDVLRDVYDFDNSGFIERLQSLGFSVAESSYANYTRTIHSIPSTLNMEYVHSLVADHVSERAASDELAKLCQNSRVVRILRERFGYRFVAFASGVRWTDCKGADEYRSPTFDLRLGEFGRAVAELTPLPILMDKILGISLARWHRERVLLTLDELPDVAREPGPKFVFAHILCPHAPFVFDEEGRDVTVPGEPVRFEMLERPVIESGTPEEIASAATRYRMRYRKQAIYMTRELEKVLSEILRLSERPPVIILQSDHGPSSPAPQEGNRFWENFANLAAYHIPGAREVPRDLGPVNTFRLLFGRCFGADLDLLPNEYYWYDGRRIDPGSILPYQIGRIPVPAREAGADEAPPLDAQQ